MRIRRATSPVVDGVVKYLSASALTTFDPASYGGCNRRWYFKYVLKRREPTTDSQKLGEQIHQQIEHYLRTGEDVLGDIARAGKHFIPSPSKKLLIEQAIHDESSIEVKSAGVPFIGYMDLVHMLSDNIPHVVDWKTSSRIFSDDVGRPGLAKTGEELAKTWQMLAYAEWVTLNMPSDSVQLSHVYFQTRGRRWAEMRTANLSTEVINERWAAAEPIVTKLKVVASLPSVADVEPHYASCGAYGGCPYYDECPKSTKGMIHQLFEEGAEMSALDKFLSNKISPEVTAEIKNLEAEEKLVILGDGKVEPVEVSSENCSYSMTQVELTADEQESKQRLCLCGSMVKIKPAKLGDGKMYALIPKHVVGAAPEKKRTQTKPTKDKTEVKNKEGLVFYVNCAPEGHQTKRLEEYVSDLCRALEAQYKVIDVRCAPKDGPLGFGAWRGVLSAFARSQPPESGEYTVDMVSETAQVVVEALASQAVVVRGWR